jgi:CheY-like chemotaxis protein/ketosteroid isomerase-like protein
MARILICDDDASYRALLRVVLEQDDDHEVAGEARDGRECIDRAGELRPEVILLDLNMPRMSGVEALPVLRDLLPETKIVALTTARAMDNEQEFVDLGGVAFIEKPHEILALRPALERVLEAVSEPRMDLVAEAYRLWWSDERERALELLAPDVEMTRLTEPETLHGVAELREAMANMSEEQKQATVEADRLLLSGDEVVLLATAAMPRRMADGQSYIERFPVAWVITVRDDKIVSAHIYRSWEDAKGAAGVPDRDEAPLERKLSRSAWRFVQRVQDRLGGSGGFGSPGLTGP